jgi:hypothetical protein
MLRKTGSAPTRRSRTTRATIPAANKAPLSQPVLRDLVPEILVDERMMTGLVQTRDQRPRPGQMRFGAPRVLKS